VYSVNCIEMNIITRETYILTMRTVTFFNSIMVTTNSSIQNEIKVNALKPNHDGLHRRFCSGDSDGARSGIISLFILIDDNSLLSLTNVHSIPYITKNSIEISVEVYLTDLMQKSSVQVGLLIFLHQKKNSYKSGFVMIFSIFSDEKLDHLLKVSFTFSVSYLKTSR
jgi:hypothetical protein